MQHQQKQSLLLIPMCSSPIEHSELPYLCVGKPIEGSGADQQERHVVEEPQFITHRWVMYAELKLSPARPDAREQWYLSIDPG